MYTTESFNTTVVKRRNFIANIRRLFVVPQSMFHLWQIEIDLG